MMIATPSSSDTLAGRECALQALLRDIIAEYKAYLEAAEPYEAYLQRKVDTRQMLAQELGGAPYRDLDDEIPF